MSLFKKKSSGFDEQDQQDKPGSGKSSGSLLVLLVLLGGFAYLYFFTSLIVPHEVAAPAKAPDVSTEVKQSMPPKPATLPANPSPAETNKPEALNPPAVPVPPAAPGAKPVTPASPPPATAKPAALPAPAAAPAKPAAPVSVPQPPAAAKPVAPAPAPSPAKKETAAPVKKDEPKPAKAAEQKPVQAVKGKGEARSPAAAAEKAVASKKKESYTIFAGEFPAGEETAAALAKLARLGIKPVTRKETRKSRSMNRLFYGAYTDYDVYSAELDKLKQSAKGAFGVEKDGKYSLYAGSFSAKERAEKEKRDLAAKGVTLQIQQTVLPLATVSISAGQFSSKKDADKAAARVKGEGLAVKVVPSGR